MATNKIVLRAIQEFMADYVPVYQPIYPLLMGKSQSWAEEVGSIAFKRLVTVGDVRAKHQVPKQSEIAQVNAGENSKTFKKYFLANQFTQSSLQDRMQVEDVMKQVLDEHGKQMDELVLFGEGTYVLTDVINNGLFWSNDPNYTLESVTDVEGSGIDPLVSLHRLVMASARKADQVAGKKVVIFYGDDMVTYFDSVFATYQQPFKSVLAATLGSNYSLMKMPASLSTQSETGFLIVNLDQVKLHYTSLPHIQSQGVNEEKMYIWTNFLMGSTMLEVQALHGVIHQPLAKDES
jgi:hypothetical protein